MGLSDPFIALLYLSFFVIGLTAPFVLTLGYVWGDTFYPQEMSSLVGMLPSSLLVAVGAVVLYLSLDRKSKPRFCAVTGITLVFAAWATLSLSWAEQPDFAYDKWNWAVKTLVFSTFLPLVFRSRVQIEAFLAVFLFALSLHMVPRGVKELISGSGYGRGLGVINSNNLLLEGSTLAAVCVAMIPMILYLRRHSVLLPKSRLRDWGGLGLLVVAIACAISTYARTALVGFVVVGVFMFVQTRRKIAFALCAAVLVLGFSVATGSSWGQRMDTTADYEQEDSALGRILVWKWTLNYVSQHPLGGGFDAYRIDRIEFPADNGQPATTFYGKAYHNMYFEVLGELGIPGLAMFASIQAFALLYLWRVIRRTRNKPYLLWLNDLSKAAMTSLLVLMACGNFIGVGFQAQIWYFIALPVCLREYLYRVEKLESAVPAALPQRGRVGGFAALPRPAR